MRIIHYNSDDSTIKYIKREGWRFGGCHRCGTEWSFKGVIYIPIIIKSTQIQAPHRIDSMTSGSSPTIISPQHQLGHRQILVPLMSAVGLIICFSLQTAILFLWCSPSYFQYFFLFLY